MNSFEGTLIIVSHDRDFLQGLTKTVYEFKDGYIKEYLGDIDYYLEEHKLENLREVEKRTKIVTVKDTSAKEAYQNTKKNQKELKKLQNKLANIETDIAGLETDIANIDMDLLDGEKYAELTSKLDFFTNYQAKKKKLEKLMADWENLHETLEN